MANATCCICSQMSGTIENDLLHQLLGGPYRRRVVDLSRAWAVMPSVGALSVGHSLLCPTAHLRSLAAVPLPEIEEVSRWVSDIGSRLTQATGGALQFFEHGNGTDESRTVCSIDHAHLHLIPGAPDLWPHVDAGVDWHPLDDGFTELPSRVGGDEYLLFGDRVGRMWIAVSQDDRFPSQLMRRALAKAVGRSDEWNWRDFPRRDMAAASLELL